MNDGSLGYLTKEGFRNVYTNRLMSIASISVLFSCLVMIGSAFLLFANINSAISGIEAQNVIMVFVKDAATGTQIIRLGEQIKSIDNVKSCEEVKIAVEYKKQLSALGDAAELFKGLTKNPIPNTFRVTVKDMSLFEDSVKKLNNLENVLRVRENSDLASKLQTIRHTVSYISIAIISMLLFVSLFIIANTIKITMFNRKLEINIMKSVGATNWFIRWPFMFEGMILGAFSGVLALFAVWGIYKLAIKSLGIMLDTGIGNGGALPFSNYAGLMLLSFIAIGICAGTFGSTVSISKYLKEQECATFEEKS